MQKSDFLSSCTSGGCGAKIGAGELSGLLDALPLYHNERLIVGFDGRDDAAVWQLDDGSALISTVDFFSPMIDDPYLFGKIAAANAISDVYAMGGTPLFALNLVCFPHKLEKSVLAAMLQGGAEKAREAKTVIAGGHSIYDHEPKYGLAVTGRAERGRFLRNNTVEAGDALVLTKSLGVGLILCAAREGAAPDSAVKAATASMETLNRLAAETAANFSPHASTDVTGFGLLVHASEMAGEKHTAVIDTGSVPIIDGALDCAKKGFVTSGGERNRAFIADKIEPNGGRGAADGADSGLSTPLAEVMLDPQTSGGLLISLPQNKAKDFCEKLSGSGGFARVIGRVETRSKGSNFPVRLD